MKTANPPSFAATKSRARFSTVLFSRTLSPTRLHDTPFSLRTSFCGSMTTTAVSLLSILMVRSSTLASDVHDAREVVGTACLDQQHRDVRIFGQPRRYDRAGR